MTVLDEVVERVDPTDSNVCSDIAEASAKALKWMARSIWAENNGMRMGRDDSREMFVAMLNLGEALKLLPYRFNGKDSDEFFARLLSETGIGAKPTI